MFSFKKLFGLEREEEPVQEIRLPEPPKKDIQGAKRGIYNQILEILDENRIHTAYPEDQVYPRLKRSLAAIADLVNINKEKLTKDRREMELLERKIADCKKERNLTTDTYDLLKFIYGNKYGHPSLLNDRIVNRILALYDLD